MLFSQAVELFCSDYAWQKGYAKSTVDNYRWMCTSFLSAVEDMPITALSKEELVRWRLYMQSKQYEVNAVNAYLYKFRRIMTHYSKLGLKLAPEDIIIPKKQQKTPRYLTKEEIDRLISVGDLREKALISLLYCSGLRVGELVKVRRKDIRGDMLLVHGKGGKEGMGFIDERADIHIKNYLASRTDSNPFLFYSYKKQGITVSCVQHLVRELGIKAGIEVRVTPHVLRHSLATHLAEAGIGSFHLQKILRHAHISTTQIYVHVSGKSVKDAYFNYH